MLYIIAYLLWFIEVLNPKFNFATSKSYAFLENCSFQNSSETTFINLFIILEQFWQNSLFPFLGLLPVELLSSDSTLTQTVNQRAVGR